MLVEDGARFILVSPYRIRLQYCHNFVQANYLWQWRCTIKYIGAFSYVLQREGHQSIWGMESKIDRYHMTDCQVIRVLLFTEQFLRVLGMNAFLEL